MSIGPVQDTLNAQYVRGQPTNLDPNFLAFVQQALGLEATGVLDQPTIDALRKLQQRLQKLADSGSGAQAGRQSGGASGGGSVGSPSAGGSGYENLIDRALLGSDRNRRQLEQMMGQLQSMLKAPGIGNMGRMNTGGQTLRNAMAQRGIDPTMDRNRAGAPSVAPAGATTTPSGPMRPGMAGLLDEIAEGEGTDDATARSRGFQSGYDVTLGYGAYTPAQYQGRPLSDMTLAEVDAMQTGMLRDPSNHHNSSAAGRYQIVRTTLRGLKREMGLSDNEKFTPELQDRMAQQLLERRGLNDFMAGRISASSFQDRLAMEWASVANSRTGVSHYGQGTGTSTNEILAAMSGLRRGALA